MTRPQLEQLQQVATQKATYLRSKAGPGQSVPAWIVKELEFIQDFQNLGIALFNSEKILSKKDEHIKRLESLITMLESALNNLMQERFQIVSSTLDRSKYPLGASVYLRLASLMPEGVDKTQLLQFYHEFTSSLLTGHGNPGNIYRADSQLDTRNERTQEVQNPRT